MIIHIKVNIGFKLVKTHGIKSRMSININNVIPKISCANMSYGMFSNQNYSYSEEQQVRGISSYTMIMSRASKSKFGKIIQSLTTKTVNDITKM